MASLAYKQSNDAADPCSGDQQRQSGERGQQHHRQPGGGHRFGAKLFESAEIFYGLVRIYGMDSRADGFFDARGRTVCSNDEGRSKRVLLEWVIEGIFHV